MGLFKVHEADLAMRIPQLQGRFQKLAKRAVETLATDKLAR
jgi:hypothetical protein